MGAHSSTPAQQVQRSGAAESAVIAAALPRRPPGAPAATSAARGAAEPLLPLTAAPPAQPESGSETLGSRSAGGPARARLPDGAPVRRDKEAEQLETVFNTVLYALAGLALWFAMYSVYFGSEQLQCENATQSEIKHAVDTLIGALPALLKIVLIGTAIWACGKISGFEVSADNALLAAGVGDGPMGALGFSLARWLLVVGTDGEPETCLLYTSDAADE